MANNVFDNTLDINNNVDTNTFDHSHTVHLSTEIGRITPVFCTYVPPKTTYRFNAVDFGLQMMPSVFPFQTPVRCRLNFFKFENRASNQDYPDMVSGVRQDIEEPYIALKDKSLFSQTFGTSKLSDYLGLPSKVTKTGVTSKPAVSSAYSDYNMFTPGSTLVYAATSATYKNSVFVLGVTGHYLRLTAKSLLQKPFQVAFCKSIAGKTNPMNVQVLAVSEYSFANADSSVEIVIDKNADYIVITDREGYLNPDRFALFTAWDSYTEEELTAENTTFGLADSPNKISAYPFRMYEAVYNQYYRDPRNNPYIKNGRPEYNQVLPTRESGPDSTVYTLHNCNWERDAFTTAVQNPQQGIKAPLAGITTYNNVRTLENGEIQTEVKTALVTEDGKKYALDYQTDEDGTALTGVKYTELSSRELVRPVTTLSELANSGISIETLRYVNAYQKYLELNMRKGFSYRDIMQGRWDIDIRFDDLLLPTFIGGISRELNMNAVTQTVDQASASDTSYESALGSQSGIAGVYGQTDNNIEVFCDEASYIMAVLTVVPTPIYSQLTPKHFFYRDLLDTPQPEFMNIGFQPILKKELNIFDKDGGNEVFGYQRPWYEFCQMFDTCHGSFRDTLGNFLMKRTFLGTPELGRSFLTVDPSQLTDVFSVTKVGDSPITDHIYGYVRFNISAKLPINRVAIPRLD